jgi:hypothetical protein
MELRAVAADAFHGAERRREPHVGMDEDRDDGRPDGGGASAGAGLHGWRGRWNCGIGEERTVAAQTTSMQPEGRRPGCERR